MTHDLSYAEFRERFTASVCAKGSNSFVPLSDVAAAALFNDLIDALLAGQLGAAREALRRLEERGIRYDQVRVADAAGEAAGFVERARPGEPGYRGWGAALVRQGAGRNRVYQAPHPWADRYSERIALQAFRDDARASAVVLAGAHRHANGDGRVHSDVAHAADNLFHALSAHLARRGLATGNPRWFIQIHGSAARADEPAIIASDGAQRSRLEAGSPLVRIKNLVDAAGHADMGVCGWREGPGAREGGSYRLCATDNAQGRMLEALGLRDWFLHFEIAWPLREGYAAGRGPGHAAIVGLLGAIRAVLE
jgi:hypothetical protein